MINMKAKKYENPPAKVLRVKVHEVKEVPPAAAHTEWGPRLRVTFKTQDVVDSEGKPFLLFDYYGRSAWNQKTKLFQTTQAILGRMLTVAELENFEDLDGQLIGMPCLVSIKHILKADGSMGYKIADVMTAEAVPALA